MGDIFQVIVDRDVSLDQAPVQASAICQWLISEKIIDPRLSDCALGGLGYAPGIKCSLAFDGTRKEVMHWRTNGLQVVIARTIFYSAGADLICDRCRKGTWEGTAFSHPLSPWSAGDDNSIFKCPHCGHETPVTDCKFDPPWGFGNLGFKFWNWPPLNVSFVAGISEMLGHRTVFVAGKL